MAQARGFVEKTALEPDEKLKCAFFYLCRGITQQDLAALFGVNPARVNDAVSEARAVFKWPTGPEPPA